MYNEITKQPISTRIEAFDANGKRIYRGISNAQQNGYYNITGLKPGDKYIIRFGVLDYFKQDYEINMPQSEKYTEISRDFLIKPKEKGLYIPMKVPTFELGKSKLRAGADYFLKDILETMQKNPSVKFKIICYPDNMLDRAENKILTDGRANSLKEFFIRNGLESERITIEGYDVLDEKNPPPTQKRSKGKRYIGSIYFQVESF